MTGIWYPGFVDRDELPRVLQLLSVEGSEQRGRVAVAAPKSPTMETKYRTLLQAAVMILVLAVIVINHSSDKGDQAVAQKTVHVRR